MTTKSILVQEIIDENLRTARQNLEQDGLLQPVLFLHLAANDILVVPLTLPDTFEKKALFFFEMGRRLHEQGLQPSEAVFLSESWFLSVQEAPDAMKLPPSEHPSPQEAIVAVGRNADNSRYTQVVQPFTRDKHNRPVWQAILIAVYDEKQTPGNGSVSILDFLFEAIPASA